MLGLLVGFFAGSSDLCSDWGYVLDRFIETKSCSGRLLFVLSTTHYWIYYNLATCTNFDRLLNEIQSFTTDAPLYLLHDIMITRGVLIWVNLDWSKVRS